MSQVNETRILVDRRCATKGDRCGVEGEPPNSSCGALVIAGKGRMRVGRTIEAIVNSNC